MFFLLRNVANPVLLCEDISLHRSIQNVGKILMHCHSHDKQTFYRRKHCPFHLNCHCRLPCKDPSWKKTLINMPCSIFCARALHAYYHVPVKYPITKFHCTLQKKSFNGCGYSVSNGVRWKRNPELAILCLGWRVHIEK